MKRNRYTKEFEEFVKNNVSKYKKEEFRLLLQDRYNIQLSSDALRRYLNSHCKEIKYKDYKKENIRNIQKYKIGAERVSTAGTFIKVAQPDKWRLKKQVMYEKYHNCKLKENEHIIFLNQDSNDFRKENLKRISKEEFMFLHNCKTFSTNPKLTQLGLLSARLMIKTKNVIKSGGNGNEQ